MFKLAVIAALASTACAVEFEVMNMEIGDIWVGILGNWGKPVLEGGGFVLAARSSMTIKAPDDWSGRFWARTWCDSNSKHCLTGDCGKRIECDGNGGVPPATVVQIALKADGEVDYYNISLVDGFNIPAAIQPIAGRGNSGPRSCTRAACSERLDDCPDPLKIVHQGYIIGCKSACTAFDTDEYCCRGAFDGPETCKKSNYSDYFKTKCPDAYSYAYDEGTSTFTCKAPKYLISFGAY